MDNKTMEGDITSLNPLNFVPNGGLEQNTTQDSVSGSGSSSPLRSDEKVRSRYLGPHLPSCHDYCKYGRKRDTEAKRLNFRKFMKKKSAQDAEKYQVTEPKVTSKVETEFPGAIEVVKPQTILPMKNSIAYCEEKALDAFEENAESRVSGTNLGDEESEVPNINKIKSESSVKKSISPVVPKAIQKKELHSVSEPPKIKQKTPLPPKRVDVPTKPAITLKTRAPMLRSLSKLKSSQSLIRRNKEKKAMRSLRTSKIDERKVAKESPPMASHDNLSSLQLRKVRSIKRSLTPHDKVSGVQLRKLSSMKRTSTSRDNISGVQLRKLGSIKRTSAPHDNVSGLQLRKVGSIKRSSMQNEGIQSLRLKKVRSIKRTLTPHEFDSRLQLKKLKSIKRASKSREGVSSLQLKKLESSKRMTTLHDDISAHDNASSLQLRKLKSIKRTLTPHDSDPRMRLKKLKSIKQTSTTHENVSSLQLRKLRSLKRTSTPHESVPNLQLRKHGSIKKTSTARDNDPSLQLRKLKSIKRMSTSHESVSNMQPRKLSSVKQTSTSQNHILGFLPRKLRSMKRSLSVKDKDKIEKAIAESNATKIHLQPNMKTEESKRVTSGVGDEKKRMSRVASTHPEDNISAPVKLKFRRGKVINLRSDSKGARNLWLNIGKLASENPISNGLLRRRSSRRSRDDASLDSKALNLEVQTVILKHQDVTEKKDAKSLFNDVIEETASKLVKTRKSKVKALVGAFETVISLLESKPPSAVQI